MIRLCITLPPQLMKRIRAFAAHSGLTISDIVRRAIEDYLSRRESENS